jgi:hypothetical protein
MSTLPPAIDGNRNNNDEATSGMNAFGPCTSLSVILLVATALLIAGCGSSSSTHSASIAGSSGAIIHRPMPGTGGGTVNDDNRARADSGGRRTSSVGSAELNPCTLVTEVQAKAIVGKPIETPQEAPLGPTCIYQSPGSKSSVTLSVESIDFAKLKGQMRNRTRVKIGKHTVYCGIYGQPATFVPLSHGRVLNVVGPCALGTRFAAAALPRLSP